MEQFDGVASNMIHQDNSIFVNPNEFGIRVFGCDEKTALIDTVMRRAIFRYSGNASFCSSFEKFICDYLGVNFSVLVCNGTAGIKAVLSALGVKRGDLVAVNAFTFVATASAVYSVGGIPIAVDFHPVTNLALEPVERLLQEGIAAVIAVHWPGRCFDLGPLKELCDKAGVPLVEDACQAFAASTGSVQAGRQGVAGIFSFQQNKLITCGEGGCVVSDDGNLIRRVQSYADHGMIRDEFGALVQNAPITTPGENLRLTELQAAVLMGQVAKLPKLLCSLSRTKALLLTELARHDIQEWNPTNSGDLGQVATFLFVDADAARHAEEKARSNRVLLKPIWTKPFHRILQLQGTDYSYRLCEPCPVADDIAARLRALPLPPDIRTDDVDKIVQLFRDLKDDIEQLVL